MQAIEKAILLVQQSAVNSSGQQATAIDVRIQVGVVVAFMVTVLSIPVDDPAKLVWLFSFPIIMSEAIGVGYAKIFTRSLFVLPLLLLLGCFNPLFDKEAVWHIGRFTISHGWLTFASLVLRGLLTFQALLILICGYGFYDICRCLQSLHCPKVLITQLLMLHRYIGVLLREVLSMERARQARGYGRDHYPLKMWGVMAGQLLIRAIQRARRVHAAMVSRGFTGIYYFSPYASAPKASDYMYLIIWIGVFAAIRFINLTAIIADKVLSI